MSLKCCGAADPSPTNSQDMQEGEFGMHMRPNSQENSPSPPQACGCPRPALLQVPWPWGVQSPREQEEDGGELLPSQKNMSQTRRTELQGSVREKAHMNHSVMYRMGSIFCLLRCL